MSVMPSAPIERHDLCDQTGRCDLVIGEEGRGRD